METNDTQPNERLEGQIKWFDPGKGFGFIVADSGGPDILLHANVLRNFGQNSISDGARIAVNVQQTERGLQAVEVLEVHPPEGDLPLLRDLADIDVDDIAAKPILPARIKWFDKAKGFGFANIFGDSADIFIHVEIVRRSGLADLQTGEAVGLRVIDGERGKMALDIVSWEVASR